MSCFSVVFPGQGSQSVGMLSDLNNAYPLVSDIYQEASDTLGYDMAKLINEGPEEELNMTSRTQPALLTASFAVWRVWTFLNGQMPSYMAGHSLGEYSALVCSGAMTFRDGLKLVETRGRLMQEAVPSGVGAMAAVLGLENEVVEACCREVAGDQVVSPVNYNAIGQVVIAGHKEAVERASVLLKEKGAKKIVPLSVSVPSHCILMKPASEKLAEVLESVEISTPVIPVFNNVDVKCEEDPAKIKDALVRQLYRPVRWTDIVVAMADAGVESQLEMGPGKVLTGTVKRIDKRIEGVSVNTPATIQELIG